MHKNSQRHRVVLALGALALPLAGHAAEYPSVKPIRMVVPFASGGSSDVVGRLIGTKIAASLKQSVVVDNRAGAGGAIGSDIVAKAAPDGYTLLLVDALHIVSPLFNRNTLYDPIRDFMPISMIAKSPVFLACNTGFEAKTVAELIAIAQKEPGKVTAGLPGSGSIVIEMLKLRGKINLNLIPYKGGAPAVNDLVAGNVNLMASTIATYGGFVKSGRLRLLATSGPARHPDYPDVPTFAEAGMPGVEYEQWFGMMAPAKLPQPVSNLLGAAIADAVKEPDLRERFSRLALDPFFVGPREFNARVLRDNARWKKVAEDAGIKPVE
jgi:tripartite-type tricarboxylate transporter receptor subunit TctC